MGKVWERTGGGGRELSELGKRGKSGHWAACIVHPQQKKKKFKKGVQCFAKLVGVQWGGGGGGGGKKKAPWKSESCARDGQFRMEKNSRVERKETGKFLHNPARGR